MKEIEIRSQVEWDALPQTTGPTVVKVMAGHVVIVDDRGYQIVLYGNSIAELRDNSRAVLWGTSTAHVHGLSAAVDLRGYSAAFAHVAAKVKRHGKTTTIIKPVALKGTLGWLGRECVAVKRGTVVLYKRVSSEWLTQEGTKNETSWKPGARLAHKAWDPTSSECGEGKFHGCSRPYFCDEFRGAAGDRYVAISVHVDDLHAWDDGQYPHKVAFRAGRVLHEVDQWGDEVKP